MNNEDTTTPEGLLQGNTIEVADPLVYSEYDYENDLNREQARKFRRLKETKAGKFTRPTKAARKNKRRAVKKAGKKTRRAAR